MISPCNLACRRVAACHPVEEKSKKLGAIFRLAALYTGEKHDYEANEKQSRTEQSRSCAREEETSQDRDGFLDCFGRFPGAREG